MVTRPNEHVLKEREMYIANKAMYIYAVRYEFTTVNIEFLSYF
jgi:hypothetical protein